MNTKLRYLAVLVAFTLVVVWCLPSFGQVIKGSISGSVVDPQGAVVPGAQVKVKNIETGVVFPTSSDSAGLFRLNLLPVGTYTVEVTSQGFKTASVSNVVVVAGKDTGLNAIKLAIGEASTTLEVSAAAPLIETTQAQITNTFSGTTLSTFAGVQENEGLDRLALFVPGVVATRSDNFSNTNGVGFSSNGLRGRNNDQEIDGQNNNDNSVGGPGLFLSNTEFVGQYVIITNQFGPEYGRNAGSVVNVITKSGSNGWHGSVFGQNRNSYTEALSNTQHNTPKPGSQTNANPNGVPFSGPPRFNEEFSGGTIGGPIVKNKAFVFGGFDSDLFSGTGVFTTTSSTPTPAGLAQLAACPFADPKALAIMQKFGPYGFSFGSPTPRPNVPVPGGGLTFGTVTVGGASPNNCLVQTGGVTRVVPTPFHGFDFVVRNDMTLGSDSLTSRYLFNRNNSFNIGDNGAGGWFRNTPALSQAILESWTHNFSPRMVNEARVSFSRLGVEFGGGLNPLEPVAGQLDQAFTNITFSGGLSIGPATNLPQSRLVNTWQAQDNWNYVLGKHALKAGVNWSYQRSPNIFLPNLNGQYRYANLGAFLSAPGTCATCGVPNRVQIAQGNPNLDFREYDTFAYAGDDWKIGRNLTLNLGVTWTYYGQPADLFHDLTFPRESNPATAFWLQSLPLDQRTNPDIPAVTNSFGPSVGFAYSPQWGGFLTGDGKTTIRGGYRMLYDPPFYNIFVNISSSAPMTFLQSITAGLTPNMLPAVPIGPNVRSALASFIKTNTFDPRTNAETNIAPDFGPDKVQSWSFGIEREVTKSAAIEARYVGNHGYNLFQTVDGNPYVGTAAKPGQLQAGLLPSNTPSCAATTQSGPGAGTDVGRLACGLGVVRTRNNGGFSDYHALQLEFRTNNLFKQLTMRTGYTWSKTLDNVSEIFATGTAGNTLFAAQNPFQTGGAERSLSGLDIPNVWTIAFTEQLPFFKEQRGLVGHILGGWTIASDYILGTGQNYTPAQNGESFLAGNAFGDVYDSGFVNAFVGDAARPFYGNINAPEDSVGMFAADACTFRFSFGGLTAPGRTALCAFSTANPNVLVSVNQLNSGCVGGSCSVTAVTTNDVRFIINSKIAQQTFGTPFGNVPRNPLRDAKSNLANASIYKNFKLGEHANFEMHLTLNNAFNHFNFTSINPNMENAGLAAFGTQFANPAVTSANGRTVWIGGKVTF
jgi:carboxypeptidase family protein